MIHNVARLRLSSAARAASFCSTPLHLLRYPPISSLGPFSVFSAGHKTESLIIAVTLSAGGSGHSFLCALSPRYTFPPSKAGLHKSRPWRGGT